MSCRRFAVLDPAAGISGDMLLGALVGAGASPDWLRGVPARLGLDGASVEVAEADRCGVRAVKVTVRAPDGAVEAPGQGHHHGHGPHRHVGELIERVRQAPLSDWVRERAVAAFRLLGEAEGRVHGVAPENVALHEVGALDALVDVVGGIEGMEQLGITEAYTGPVATGRGWVHAAHGHLPVPAPATALLLTGFELAHGGPVEGEATTPTGAALLRVLCTPDRPPAWRPVTIGWGAGTRNPAGYPNALRLFVAEAAAEQAEVVVVAADIDDLSPEYLEPLRAGLVAAGALDVQVWATQGKKGRLGFRVEALAPPGREDAVAEAFFAHSTTAGVRLTRTQRRTLAREQVAVTTGDGAEVRVKRVAGPAGARVKPEFDDVEAAARRSGRPALDVAAEAGDLARRMPDAARDATLVHKESQ